jgi:hypothetical protein
MIMFDATCTVLEDVGREGVLTLNEEMLRLLIKCLHLSSSYLFYI